MTANLARNAGYSAGDVVKHRQGGEVAVVVERMGKHRIVVRKNDKTTVVWYAASVVKICERTRDMRGDTTPKMIASSTLTAIADLDYGLGRVMKSLTPPTEEGSFTITLENGKTYKFTVQEV